MDYEKNQAYVLVAALLIILGLMGYQLLSGFIDNKSGSEIVIIYTGNLEGNVDGNNGTLSFPSYISAVQQIRHSTNNNVILIDSGDALHGYFLTTSSEGELMIDLMDIAKYDAIAIGDMDLNYNISQLGQLQNRANFSFLCANVYNKDDELLFKPYIIKEVNGVKVGIFSVMSEDALSIMHPKVVGQIKIKDVISTSREIVKTLESKNVDVIVCLAHFCLNEGIDSPYSSESFAKDVYGIDLIIDDNNEVYPYGNWVGDTLIVQSGNKSNPVSLVDLVKKDDSLTLYSQILNLSDFASVNNTTAEDRIKTENERYNTLKNEVIGSTDTILLGDTSYTRSSLTNLGCLIADSMRWKSDADVAFVESASIRSSIPAGEITRAQVDSVLPSNDEIVVKKISGAALISLLEKSLESYPKSSNNFLQFSGIKISVNSSNPVGEKIVAISINDEPVAAGRSYTVAITGYLSSSYTRFPEVSQAKTEGFHGSTQEALASYIIYNDATVDDVDARLTQSG
ncbi:MAG: bifunctional metallophosphatase/5'-nucleotidase [Methanosarcinaceae archaeon]|nr:bifunctional metallophosphatase/5'-nucleotidase [Methanosarcinaceae archaeon]